MDRTFRVVCSDGEKTVTFPDLDHDAAVARCEAERAKPWVSVAVECEKTGAGYYRYPGAAARVVKARPRA